MEKKFKKKIDSDDVLLLFFFKRDLIDFFKVTSTQLKRPLP